MLDHNLRLKPYCIALVYISHHNLGTSLHNTITAVDLFSGDNLVSGGVVGWTLTLVLLPLPCAIGTRLTPITPIIPYMARGNKSLPVFYDTPCAALLPTIIAQHAHR